MCNMFQIDTYLVLGHYRYLRLNILYLKVTSMKYLVFAHKRFIYYTPLCLKSKHVKCLRRVTTGRLGTKHFRFTV